MPISSTTRKAGPFSGNGSTVDFVFSFKVFAESDVRVVRACGLGVETDQVQDVDYTISLNEDQEAAPGGVVTLPEPLTVGCKLVLLSDIPDTQPQDWTNQGGFYPENLNDGLDRVVALVQQIRELLGRAITLPATSENANLAIPTPQANQLLAWNASGDLVNFDPANLVSVVSYGSTRVDKFAGTGAQTSFPLSANPGVQNNLRVSIDGVVQLPGEDFVWGGGLVLTFTSAPPDGTVIMAQYQQALIDLGGANADLSNVSPDIGRVNLAAVGAADLASASGASLVGLKTAGVGSVLRTASQKLLEIGLTPEDFGAVGDWNPATKTGTDDTLALQRWFNALAFFAQGAVSKVTARMPAKFYRYTGQITLDVSGLTWQGAGAGTCGFVYDGPAVAVDTIVLGHDSGAILNWSMSGMRFCCNVVMPAGGTLVRAKGLVNSAIYDVVVQGPDHGYYANGKCYDGWWFDGVGYVYTDAFNIDTCGGDGLIVTPHTGNPGNAGYPYTGLVLGSGKIGGCTGVGLHIAGGVGGVVNQGTDVIANGVNTKLDRSRHARNHEQVYLRCFDDSSTVGANIEIDDPENGQSGGTLVISSWSATAKTHAVHIKSAPRWSIQIVGATIANNLFGDGIRIEDPTTLVVVDGCTFLDHPAGYCINPAVTGHKAFVGNNFFVKNNAAPLNPTYPITQRGLSGPSQSTDFYTGQLAFKASASGYAPISNRDAVFRFISNTQVQLAVRGDDGVVRTANLTLS